MYRINKRKSIICAAYSFIFASALLIGLHLHIENIYSGTKENNYFVPLGMKDVLAFAAAFLVCFIISYLLLDCRLLSVDWESCISSKWLLFIALVIFICYVPWLLQFYPGFIFGDTITSLRQIVGEREYSNHHPLFYTLFIKCCMRIGRGLFSSNTAGLAIYSLIQMFFLSLCFSYIINWCRTRFRLPGWTFIFGVLIYGISPYIASYSIAIWKDPVFSASIAVMTCLLMDGAKRKRLSRNESAAMILLCLNIAFSRNNGPYVLLGAFIFAMFYLLKHKEIFSKKGICTMLAVIIGSFIITHPIFNHFELNTDGYEETYGVLINQMARVAAYDTDLDDEEVQYLDKLFPFNKYPEAYRPCCLDLLKWDEEFDETALERGFFEKWASIGIKNPGEYIKSWILTTGGFWLPYAEAAAHCNWNITGGAPRNNDPDFKDVFKDWGIVTSNLLGSNQIEKALKIENRSIPIGCIAWILLYLIIIMVYRKDYELLFIGTGLSVCLLLTLVVASPIFYWPRYGLAVQILLPVYCLLILASGQDEQYKRYTTT